MTDVDALDIDDRNLVDALWLAKQFDPDYVATVLRLWHARRLGADRYVSPPATQPGTDSLGRQDNGAEESGTEGEHANVYQPDGGPSHWAADVRKLPILAVPALRRAAAIARALKPLKRMVSAPGLITVDEERTATLSAEARRTVPMYRASRERWLELALVIDDGVSMGMWRQTARELAALFERHGAFRDVRTWRLRSDDKLRPVLIDPAGRDHLAQEITDPTGRRLVLLLTDAVDDLWRSTDGIGMLRKWATHNPVVIVQVLPESMWKRTGLPTMEMDLCHIRPGLIAPALGRDAGLSGGAPSLWLPTIGLDDLHFGRWARLLTGHDRGPVPMQAVALARLPAPPVVAAGTTPSAQERVARFHATASAVAFDLAGYLAAAPLTVPVMQVVQRAALPDSEPGHLAEVMLSGLVERIGPPEDGVDPDDVVYDFDPEVRDQLLRMRTRRETIAVLDALVVASPSVAGRLGTVDISALAADPSGHLLRNVHSRAFAKVAVTVLGGLGGAYADRAVTIESALRTSRVTTQPRAAKPVRAPSEDRAATFAMDPTAPLFFLSYARPRPQPRRSVPYQVNEHVRGLYEDLSLYVAGLSHIRPGPEPGFIDHTMRGGRAWESALLRAAGTCQVFVALISPAYVDSSPWQASEWDMFSRRAVYTRSTPGEPGGIAFVPVLWGPMTRPAPRRIAEVPPFVPTELPDPAVGARYQVEGLYRLARTDEDAYQMVLWSLAKHIQRLLATQWVRPISVAEAGSLQTDFDPRRR